PEKQIHGGPAAHTPSHWIKPSAMLICFAIINNFTFAFSSSRGADLSGQATFFSLSPKPTLEDARSWSTSFEKLMKSAAGRGCFRQFLRTEFSEENMMFWLACEELKKETNKTVVEEKVRQIYEDFISILSPKEVSLDSRVRDVINRNMLEPTSHTFDDAQQQIYTLMQRDSYPRFMNSTAYTDLVKSLEDSSQR
uniref:RGS domain-containing protein n=1 Tax=Myripristis murdjan TaxID=586833 RepID=A0A668ANW2_9TELE